MLLKLELRRSLWAGNNTIDRVSNGFLNDLPKMLIFYCVTTSLPAVPRTSNVPTAAQTKINPFSDTLECNVGPLKFISGARKSRAFRRNQSN